MAVGLVLRKTKNGKGAFATRLFKAEEEILEFKGKLFSYSELPVPYNSVEDHFVQVGPKLYLGPSGGIDDFVNHSCDPNAGLRFLGRKFVLVAIRDITAGEEVTFDYSTTMDEDEWELQCNCGSKKCRRVIRDFKYLPREIQKKYISAKVVPEFILGNLA
ncbi:MAG: SET domain-containing protein [Candidatus Micrarchaeota archaeon]